MFGMGTRRGSSRALQTRLRQVASIRQQVDSRTRLRKHPIALHPRFFAAATAKNDREGGFPLWYSIAGGLIITVGGGVKWWADHVSAAKINQECSLAILFTALVFFLLKTQLLYATQSTNILEGGRNRRSASFTLFLLLCYSKGKIVGILQAGQFHLKRSF